MNSWRQAVYNYENGVQSIAQQNLQGKESLARSKAGLVTAKTGELEAMTGEKFSDRLKEQSNKFLADMGLDLSAAGVAPTVLRGASKLAQMRSNALNSKWKTTQAERFNEQERQAGADAEQEAGQEAGDMSADAGSGPGPVSTLLEGQEARGPIASNIRATVSQAADEGVNPSSVSDYFSSGRNGATASDLATGNADVSTEMGHLSAEPGFADPAATPFTDSMPSYARAPGRIGAVMRDYARRSGYGGSATSEKMGDAINSAKGEEPAQAPQASNRPNFATAEDDEFGPSPFGDEFGLQGGVKTLTSEVGGRGPLVQPEEPTPIPQAEPATTGEALRELPKITVQDIDPDVQPEITRATQTATREATQAEQQAEQQAGADVEDLAPEITSASEAWGTVGGLLGDAIPIVGFGLGLYGLAEGIKDAVKSEKEAGQDPYASIRPQIKSAENQISGLEANVGADEFASKIGARQPQFGSIAAAPQLDTAKMQGVALHI